MTKVLKADSTRKPPLPQAEHSVIDDWCAGLAPDLQPIVSALDELIRATVPGLHFAVKYNKGHYGLPRLGWIMQVAPYFKSVNLVFFGGAEFPEPPPLGVTGRTRYVKLVSEQHCHDPLLASWVAQAGRTTGWM